MPINKFWLAIPIGLFIVIYLMWPEDEQELIIEDHITVSNEDISQKKYENQEKESTDMMVDVKGEVRAPGVYEMKEGQRVVDVIEEAGGLTNDADQTSVNLAMILTDEMVINVLKQDNLETPESNQQTNSNKIRINVADISELTQIPGIGEQKASAIIQYREENGYFKSAEDLLNISGIGEKTLERIREFIMVP